MANLSDDEVVSIPLGDRLSAAGVRDVKFFFQPDVSGKPLSETMSSVDLVLTSYLAGQFELMEKLAIQISIQIKKLFIW